MDWDQVRLLGSGYFLRLVQMTKNPDAGSDVGCRIVSVTMLLTKEVSYAL
jgi:hypothetical protein